MGYQKTSCEWTSTSFKWTSLGLLLCKDILHSSFSFPFPIRERIGGSLYVFCLLVPLLFLAHNRKDRCWKLTIICRPSFNDLFWHDDVFFCKDLLYISFLRVMMDHHVVSCCRIYSLLISSTLLSMIYLDMKVLFYLSALHYMAQPSCSFCLNQSSRMEKYKQQL